MKIIVDKFSEIWLEGETYNKLQSLWKRKDPLSSYELYTLGNSLISIEKKNHDWFKDNIKKVKSKNNNQVNGAIFEIFAAALFNEGKNQNLIIPPVNTPGYDLILTFRDNSRINISCKNHGISNHEKRFKESTLFFEKKFVEMCNKHDIKLIQCRIYIKEYPEDHDWNLLNKWIESIILKAKKKSIRPEFDVWQLKNWLIGISGIVSDHFDYDPTILSYNILIVSPFHKNEIKNLHSNLSDDCDNLSEHGGKQDEKSINIICVHLHPTASLNGCEKRTKEYFEEFNDKNVAGILYLQPRLEKDEKKMVLVCGYRFVTNEFFEKWANPRRQIDIHFPAMNYFSEEDAIIKFVEDTFEEQYVEINSEEIYVAQRVNYHGTSKKGKLLLPLNEEFVLM